MQDWSVTEHEAPWGSCNMDLWGSKPPSYFWALELSSCIPLVHINKPMYLATSTAPPILQYWGPTSLKTSVLRKNDMIRWRQTFSSILPEGLSIALVVQWKLRISCSSLNACVHLNERVFRVSKPWMYHLSLLSCKMRKRRDIKSQDICRRLICNSRFNKYNTWNGNPTAQIETPTRDFHREPRRYC